jgi:hypothetical protein
MADRSRVTKISKFALMLAAVAALFAFAGSRIGLHAGPSAGNQSALVVDDWTHHRLMFSDPGTLADAARHGAVDKWLKVTSDPRFRLQQSKQQGAGHAGHGRLDFREETRGDRHRDEHDSGQNPFAHTPSDKLPRGVARVKPQDRGERGNPLHAGRRDRVEALGTLNTDWSEDMGAAATAGLGNFPAKFSFDVTQANCGNSAHPDFVVYNTGLSGVPGPTGQASIIAYDNLYTGGCTAPTPKTYWAYNTAGGQIVTSVIFSPDGTQVAFAQTVGGVASLVILKWAASTTETVTNPDTLAITPMGSYRACPAPCMTTIGFAGGANDSGSSPFFDYTPGSDVLYIGDDAGNLHKFMGVFAGSPTEAGGTWPVSVSTQPLGGPVYDSVSGNIFVGDYLLDTSSTCELSGCGFFYSVASSTGAVAGTSSRLDFLSGIVDSALVDSSAGMEYVFAGADGSTSCSGPCSAVYQFPKNFTSGGGTETKVGSGFEFMLSGAFDNQYMTSGSAASPTGHLYVVGNTGLANNTLYQISITSNVMSGTAVAGPVLADNFTQEFVQAGMQVTEFENGAHDYIFLSVLSFGSATGCSSGGCVLGFDVASGTISGSTVPVIAAAEAGGTSGIVIDNFSLATGASNIYFTTLSPQPCSTSGGTGGCAIQTSQ